MTSNPTRASSAPVTIEKANELYARGLCDQAIKILLQELQIDPSQPGILTLLVELLVDSGQYRMALDVIGNAEDAGAETVPAMLLGLCHYFIGDDAAAGKIARSLLDMPSQRGNALCLMAKISFRSEDYVLSEKLFRNAIACDPGCGWAYLGMGYLQREQGNPADSLTFFERAFNVMSSSREAALAFHESAVAFDRYPLAEETFRGARMVHRFNRRLRFLLIDVLLRQDKFHEAMSEIESCMVDFGIDDGLLHAALSVRKRIGALRIDLNEHDTGTVSLCMIVKNEETHLARCLHSAKPLVTEIIVVDTGSTDRTRDIASAFGARVFNFSWVDDFSAARNFGLSKAHGKWILVLDADEALSTKDYEKFKRTLAASASLPAAYRIRTRNYSNQVNTVGFRLNRGEFPEEEGMGWFPSDKVRLFTNDSRIKFSYPVHELVEPSLQQINTPINDCPMAVHHYGTLRDVPTIEKTKRYRKLGRHKLKAYPKGAAALKELAIQASRVADYAESLDLWRRFVQLQPRSAEAHLNIGTICLNLGKFAEALAFAQKAAELDPSLKEAEFNIALSLLLTGKGREAKMILEGLLREQPDYLAGRFMLCVTHGCLREMSQAGIIFNQIKSLPIGEYLGESFLDIAKRLLAASCNDYARLTLETALTLGCTTAELSHLLDHCRVGG